jgi:hypothetical protein
LALAFAPLKTKSQPKSWIQEAAFSKSRLSRSANLKAPLDLLLVAFGWNCETYIEEFLTTFGGFHQTVFSFLTAYSLQQLFPQLTAHNNFFHSHSPTKQTLKLSRNFVNKLARRFILHLSDIRSQMDLLKELMAL